MRACIRVGAIVVAAAAASTYTALSLDAQTKPAAAPAAKPKPASGGPTKLSPEIVARIYTGDFDGMVKRRLIRVLTPYSKTNYFIDKGVQRGTAYEGAVKFEEEVNKKQKTTIATKIHVVVIPTSRDDLYDALVKGRGDIIVAGVTVTPEREKLVDFTIPTLKGIDEIVVTGPGAGDCHRGRPVGPDRGRSRQEHPVRDPSESQRDAETAGQGADDDPHGADGPRGRRHPRNV